MSAIAIDLPDDVVAARDGIVAFAEQEVIPRHQRNYELFENPRALYREDGRFSDALIELIREVRVASAEAGFYQMCVPEALGGGGLGHLAYYVAWQELFHRCGPRYRLMLYALAHWAFGPSRLLEQVTPEARERIMPGLMGINSAMLLDQGHAAVKELSMTKAYSVQVGFRAVDRAMQTHGAKGFTNELGLTEAWHALRIVNVADGTNEILNRTVVGRLLKGDLDL